MYQVVAARRQQWDQLVWQVPILSLTGQAFLFTISLGSTSSTTARVIAALLSLVMVVISIELMSRHRQAEIMDAHWLEAYEKDHFNEGGDERYVVHGLTYRVKRNSTPSGPLGRLPGYWTWVTGLTLFGFAAVAVFAIAVLKPELLR